MKALRQNAAMLVIGLILGSVMIGLWAQEAQMINRPVVVNQGHLTVTRGVAISGGGASRDYRTNTTVSTESAVTYTAAQVLTGLVTRNNDIRAVTDVLPTAADLYTAMPGAVAGTSFWLAFDRGSSSGAAVTLNGASTGVTYGEGCANALTSDEGHLILITFTSTSAYRATCFHADA